MATSSNLSPPPPNWSAAADARLRAGAAMTFHQRLQWNARMVALWRRWHPRLAERVARERVPLR